VGDRERGVHVWELHNQSLLAECELPTVSVAIDFDPRGRWLVSQDQTDTLHVWDFAGDCRSSISRIGNGRWQIAFAPDGGSLLAGNYSRGFELLKLPGGQRLGAVLQPGMSGAGSAPEVAAARPRLVPSLGAAVTYDGRRAIKIWNLPQPNASPETPAESAAVQIAVSEDVRHIAVGSIGGEVRLLSGTDVRALRTFADNGPSFIGHRSEVTSLRFDPTGRWVASGALDGTLRVWDTRNGMPRNFFARHGDGAVLDIAFLPGSTALASVSRNSAVVVDAITGELHARVEIQAVRPALAVSRDGEWIYVAGDRGGVSRWNWRAGSVAMLSGEPHGVLALALSEDGQWLATVGRDRIVRLRHPPTDAPLDRVFAATAPIDAVWFAHGGKHLYLQMGAWLHALDVEADGLVARRTRALPDPETRAWPAPDDRSVFLISGPQADVPAIRRLSDAESWAQPPGTSLAELAETTRVRLGLVVNELGQLKPRE
jgi:WD40 repeat protein